MCACMHVCVCLCACMHVCVSWCELLDVCATLLIGCSVQSHVEHLEAKQATHHFVLKFFRGQSVCVCVCMSVCMCVCVSVCFCCSHCQAVSLWQLGLSTTPEWNKLMLPVVCMCVCVCVSWTKPAHCSHIKTRRREKR